MPGVAVSQPIANLSLMDLREKFGLERDRIREGPSFAKTPRYQQKEKCDRTY